MEEVERGVGEEEQEEEEEGQLFKGKGSTNSQKESQVGSVIFHLVPPTIALSLTRPDQVIKGLAYTTILRSIY